MADIYRLISIYKNVCISIQIPQKRIPNDFNLQQVSIDTP